MKTGRIFLSLSAASALPPGRPLLTFSSSLLSLTGCQNMRYVFF